MAITCSHEVASRKLVAQLMAGTDGGRLHGLVDEQVVSALDAIDQALEQALVARSEREQRWQLNQLRGLLLTIPTQAPASRGFAACDQGPGDPHG